MIFLYDKRIMRRIAYLTGFILFFLTSPLVMAQQEAEALLLIARPQIRGSIFTESVVLVTRHGRSRPMGVILNKPSDMMLSTPEAVQSEQRPLNVGGPVSPQIIVYIFQGSALAEGRSDMLRLGADLFMGMGDAALSSLLQRKPDLQVRAFAGLASWAHGQLENEIARGDWLVLPYDADTVMQTDVANLWKVMLARASQRQI